MLSLAAAWLLFPAVLLAVSAGLGLAVDWIVGRHLPGTLILPLGMAGAIAVARLVTSADATAELALPLLVLVAVAGLVLGRERLAATWSERHALVAAGLVFVVVGAPAYMSLEPTFLGYLQLPDTGHQLSIASFTPDGGTDYEKLEPSSYRDVLAKYIGTEYPIAPQATLGVLAPLGAGLDIAWLYHPFLAVLLAMGALSIYTLASAVTSRLLRAGVAFAGASSALVYSFALQGSIKEVAALAMLLATTAAAADLITEKRPARGLFAVLLPAVAMLGSLGPAAGAYLAPVLAVVVLVAVVRVIRGRRWREAVALLVAVVAAIGLAAAGPRWDQARLRHQHGHARQGGVGRRVPARQPRRSARVRAGGRHLAEHRLSLGAPRRRHAHGADLAVDLHRRSWPRSASCGPPGGEPGARFSCWRRSGRPRCCSSTAAAPTPTRRCSRS